MLSVERAKRLHDYVRQWSTLEVVRFILIAIMFVCLMIIVILTVYIILQLAFVADTATENVAKGPLGPILVKLFPVKHE
ncbi:unnamed protein product [Bursaphelenchus xylophilus]|uniref:(pine wood nematode) hypothetical protein n=1 Tax=Bursaphelenchus xylophilus TaxID=6326 RepID=A0A7I8XJW1_BURXY|nr:unnamed protein product [Bursaphelenchus xylophilus]CAG9121264.1 unnamed protein product [Bursaphelenchus xylophilus]